MLVQRSEEGNRNLDPRNPKVTKLGESKKFTRHNTIKLTKVKDKEKIVKAAREK